MIDISNQNMKAEQRDRELPHTSLYAQWFNYIRDQRTIQRLGRTNILRATLVFLPIGRHNHWSMVTADMLTKKIHYEDPISGTFSVRG